ncbi:MAG: hypothetical protein ACK2TV_06920 [Anaerolineales bacterium]|jgi:hypothetical protein
MYGSDKIKSVVLSWDFLTALLIIVVFALIVPVTLPVGIAREIFSVSVSVLSIVFSIFFAALAVVMTAGDNQFVGFLKRYELYEPILWSYRLTLLLLFFSLLLSLILYIAILPMSANVMLQEPDPAYPSWILLIFGFFAFWSLFATANAALDAIRYAQYRASYMDIITSLNDNDLPHETGYTEDN